MRNFLLVLVLSQLTSSPHTPANSSGSLPGLSYLNSSPASLKAPSLPPLTNEEIAFYHQLAKRSWLYLDKHYDPGTGFVKATPEWPATTLWDIGGQLLAYQGALHLGLITPEEHKKRLTKTLNTLENLELYQGQAFNRVYATKDGQMEKVGRGWSSTDLGRFFVALKIIAQEEPNYQAQIERIVKRNNFSSLTRHGYLQGQTLNAQNKTISYQEGRIGYEQYSAKGFDLWGGQVKKALNLKQNATPVKVLGVTLPADKRWQDRLLSEPFILYAIELGLTPELSGLTDNLLKVQEARFKQTGQITIASEDAVSLPPSYFYYYCIYCSRKPFVVESAPGQILEIPKWVSTKAAIGWYAIRPTTYTTQAKDLVIKSWDPTHGFASGIMESTAVSTKTYDINTAAVLLEIAWFKLRGSKPFSLPGDPLLKPASATP